MAVDTTGGRTAVRGDGDNHAHLQRALVGAGAPGVVHVARVAPHGTQAGVGEHVAHPRGAEAVAGGRNSVAGVHHALLRIGSGRLLAGTRRHAAGAAARGATAARLLLGLLRGLHSRRGRLLGLGGSQQLLVALGHELLDLVGKAVQQV